MLACSTDPQCALMPVESKFVFIESWWCAGGVPTVLAWGESIVAAGPDSKVLQFKISLDSVKH